MAQTNERVSVRSQWTRLEHQAGRPELDVRLLRKKWGAWNKRANEADLLWATDRFSAKDITTVRPFARVLGPWLFLEVRKRYLVIPDEPRAYLTDSVWARLALAVAIVEYSLLERQHQVPLAPRGRIGGESMGRLEALGAAGESHIGIWHAAALMALGSKNDVWAAERWWQWATNARNLGRVCGRGDDAWSLPTVINTTNTVVSDVLVRSWSSKAWRRLEHLIGEGVRVHQLGGGRVAFLLWISAQQISQSKASFIPSIRACARAALIGLLQLPDSKWPKWVRRMDLLPMWHSLWTGPSFQSTWMPSGCRKVFARMVLRHLEKALDKRAGERRKMNWVAGIMDVVPMDDIKGQVVAKVGIALKRPAAASLAAVLLARRDLGIPEAMRLEATAHPDVSVRTAAILGI